MEWNIIVGLVCTVLGAVISYATFSRNKGKDDRSSGQQLGTVLTELGYIKAVRLCISTLRTGTCGP